MPRAQDSRFPREPDSRPSLANGHRVHRTAGGADDRQRRTDEQALIAPIVGHRFENEVLDEMYPALHEQLDVHAQEAITCSPEYFDCAVVATDDGNIEIVEESTEPTSRPG